MHKKIWFSIVIIAMLFTMVACSNDTMSEVLQTHLADFVEQVE